MVEPKAPAAARIMAANSLMDRGWGKAAQLVDVQGDVKHLVEVRLSVVQPKPECNFDAIDDAKVFELKGDSDDRRTFEIRSLTSRSLSNSAAGFGSFLEPGAGEVPAGDPVKTILGNSANNIRMRSRRRGKIDLAIASSGPNAGPKAKENGRHDHERDHNCVPTKAWRDFRLLIS